MASAICRPSHLASDGPQHLYVPFNGHQCAADANGTVSIKRSFVLFRRRLPPATSVIRWPSPFFLSPNWVEMTADPDGTAFVTHLVSCRHLSARPPSPDRALTRVNQSVSRWQLAQMVRLFVRIQWARFSDSPSDWLLLFRHRAIDSLLLFSFLGSWVFLRLFFLIFHLILSALGFLI